MCVVLMGIVLASLAPAATVAMTVAVAVSMTMVVYGILV